MSNKEAKEHIINEAGFNKRKLFSNPFAYLLHKIVSKINAPPEGIPPKRNESPNESPKIHKISESGMFKLEYERQIKIKEAEATNAEPPRAKIEKSGNVKPPARRLIPRLSAP